MKIYVAGGGGRSVATAAETVGREVASRGGLAATVEDVAPTSAADPSGTVEFYAIIFISIGASLGATAFGYIMGKVRRPATLAAAHADAGRLLGAAGRRRDGLRRRRARRVARTYLGGVRRAVALRDGRRRRGHRRRGGVRIARPRCCSPCSWSSSATRPPRARSADRCCRRFYSTFTRSCRRVPASRCCAASPTSAATVPQTPLVTLAIWGAAGCLLAVLATASRVNYRALYERFAGRDRTVLRPRAPITGRSTRRRRRRRSGSTAGWSGRTRSTTTRRSAASSAPSSWIPISPSPAGASPTPIGPELQQGVGGVRPGRPRGVAGACADGTRAGRATGGHRLSNAG